MAHDVRLARVVFEDSNEGIPSIGSAKTHVLFELGDHLGSTSVVLDKATGELVERSTFQAYGGAESDYRPERWKAFREDHRFTGKEEDVEVGLAYFGKRFYSAHLSRWISRDPLAIQEVGDGDGNIYLYVNGGPFKAIDPLGLDKVMIVASGSNEASMRQFAEQWKASQNERLADGRIIRSDLSPGERHVVTVSARANAQEMQKAMEDAAEQAKPGGKVILAVGHGAGEQELGTDHDHQSQPMVDLGPAAKGTALRVTEFDLATAKAAEPDQNGTKGTQHNPEGVGLLTAFGKSLQGHGVTTLELLTCKVGTARGFLQDIADRVGVKVQAHEHRVMVTPGSPPKMAETDSQKEPFVPRPGTESSSVAPTPEAEAVPAAKDTN